MTDLRFLTAGESHGPTLLMILDGIPAGLKVSEQEIDRELHRRQKGAGSGDRMHMENDHCQILCGIMDGRTTGAPIGIQIDNLDHKNWQKKACEARTIPRPGHVDLAAAIKYSYPDLRPGFERASARETTARVAVGAICKALLSIFDIKIGGYVTSIATIRSDLGTISYPKRFLLAERNAVRCPDEKAASAMQIEILKAKENGETLGGVIEVVCLNPPPGLGSHIQWDQKLDGRLAQAIISIPAIKGVEIGSAFENTKLVGSQVQDVIQLDGDILKRQANRAGGLEGGITNGSAIWVRAAMKPIPTTLKPQPSVDLENGEFKEMVYERSDICPVPRAVVVVEAMMAFVIAQALLKKTGGDSISEILKRFNSLKQSRLMDLEVDSKRKVWWP